MNNYINSDDITVAFYKDKGNLYMAVGFLQKTDSRPVVFDISGKVAREVIEELQDDLTLTLMIKNTIKKKHQKVVVNMTLKECGEIVQIIKTFLKGE